MFIEAIFTRGVYIYAYIYINIYLYIYVYILYDIHLYICLMYNFINIKCIYVKQQFMGLIKLSVGREVTGLALCNDLFAPRTLILND